jgi:ribulose-phosphate 3-epimerase
VRRVLALFGCRPFRFEIDGGVSPETAPLVCAAGADVLVAGAAIFQGGSVEAYRKNIEAIRTAADKAR